MLTKDQYQIRVIRAFTPHSNNAVLNVPDDIDHVRAAWLQEHNFARRVLTKPNKKAHGHRKRN